MRKRKTKKTANRKKPEIGDFVELEVLDSGATWGKSFHSPEDLTLGTLKWTGRLVRQDKEITAVDSGGTVEDENYTERHEYHLGWTPAVKEVRLIERCKKNRR